MPRIALVTTSYPNSRAGNEAAGSFVEDFARELSTLVDVTVVAASREQSVSRAGNLTVRRFAVPRLPLSLLKPQVPWHWPAVLRTLRAGRRAVRACIAEDAPDHVVALWALPGGWWAKVEGGRRGIPYSTWALGSDIWTLSRVPGIRRVLADVLRGAQQRYADGIELCRDVETISGRSCSFLPSTRKLPTQCSRPASCGPPYNLAFLGRWHPNKGVDLMMAALEQLDDDDWARIGEVRIFGGGPLQKQVLDASARLASRGRPVNTGGYLDKAEAARLIGWADYLLLPSRVESIPVIFSDAAQLGTAMITTPVGDLPALQDRHPFGRMASSASDSDYCRAIQSALRDSPARFKTGLDSHAGDFSLSAIVTNLVGDLGLE